MELKPTVSRVAQALLIYAVCHAVASSLLAPPAAKSSFVSDPHRAIPRWPPGTNLSVHVYLSSATNKGDVFAKTRMAPEIEARRKLKAEMRAKGYIGHGAWRKPLEPTDPDYKEQLYYHEQIRKQEERRQARLAREAEEAAEQASQEPAEDTVEEVDEETTEVEPHAGYHGAHGHGAHGHGGHGMNPHGGGHKPRGGVMEFLTAPQKPSADLPSFVWHNVTYGDMRDRREIDLDIEVPFSVKRNSPVWADVFITVNGSNPDPVHPDYVAENVHHTRIMLTRYFPRRKWDERGPIRSKEWAKDNEFLSKFHLDHDDRNAMHQAHWHPELTLTLVNPVPSLDYRKLDADVKDYVHAKPGASSEPGHYYPIVHPINFWKIDSHMIPVTTRTEYLPLHVTFYPTTFANFKSRVVLDRLDNRLREGPDFVSSTTEEIKAVLLETSPWLLASIFVLIAIRLTCYFFAPHEVPGMNVSSSNLFDMLCSLVIISYLFGAPETANVVLIWECVGLIQLLPTIMKSINRRDQEDSWSGIVQAALIVCAVGSMVLYQKYSALYRITMAILVSAVYITKLTLSILRIIDYPTTSTKKISSTALALIGLDSLLDDCFAWMFGAPAIYRYAAMSNQIAFGVLFYKWIDSIRRATPDASKRS